ncbi:MAG: Phosphoribosylglycinamide formyltransferase [Acidimicrobiales bacterium]|nr:MAG: phosphoribosylglycinamide formyltransferase [Actinomycetota bacterium]MBV6507966.1 Phosphoribosylglycinamide formyltransferase [Acidimicrobiales bacterium]RIK06939.1 MAG: phosphoribosylglycinamide formyltransferase [Acidobacteriota bacterium]
MIRANVEIVRIAVLASGTGSILESMFGAGLRIEVVLIDRPCRAREVAAAHDTPVVLVERSSYGSDFDRVAYTHAVVDALEPFDVDLVVMAGFGTILEKPMHDAYENRILNTHPALLPAFPGWHSVRDALDYGVKVTGCTVHVATLAVDSGPILAQEAVPVLPGDTEESLHERIKTVERRLYIDTIKEIIERGHVL